MRLLPLFAVLGGLTLSVSADAQRQPAPSGGAAAPSAPAQAQPATPTQSPPAPQAPPQPAALPAWSERHAGDWTHRCMRPHSEAPQVCEVTAFFSAQAPGQAPIRLQIALGPSTTAGQMRLVALVPANVALTVPIQVSREGATLPALAYDLCHNGFCRAAAELSQPVFDRMLSARPEGRVQFRTADGQDIAIMVSFQGFREMAQLLRAP